MYYSNLLNKNLRIYPIFWTNKIKNPVFLWMDDNSEWFNNLNLIQIKDQKNFNNEINNYAKENKSDLIISGYLEKREKMFKFLWFEQMVLEQRFYHLWLDLSAPVWTELFCPLDWEVVISEYEYWEGNYWGMIVLKHDIDWFIFYSIYWHQNKEFLPPVWKFLKAWEFLSKLWDFSENWGYFHHLHLQLLTKEWFDNWFVSKGYVDLKWLEDLNKYIIDPNYIFRY